MKRRDFLKTSVVAGVALSLNFEGLQAALSSNTVAVEQAPDLVAVMGGEPAVMLDKALEALGGIGKYIKKGQKVVIKPNIGWDRTPELAGNTNPELIKALVKKCFEAGAEKVTVFDHTCDNWQKCYETSGIAAAVKEAGGIIMPGNDEKYFKEVDIPNGVTLKKAKIHESLIEADAWINVPILKNHGGAKLHFFLADRSDASCGRHPRCSEPVSSSRYRYRRYIAASRSGGRSGGPRRSPSYSSLRMTAWLR